MTTHDPKDKYFDQAKKEGYRARSVYKLQEIQEKYDLMQPGHKVLDLGAAPGSFLQYISEIVGAEGYTVGVDITRIQNFPEKHIYTLKANVMDNADFEKKMGLLGAEVFDVVISDMAPKTTGVKFMDAGKSMELNRRVLAIADKYLRIGGHVVMKLLPGVNEGEIMGPMKKMFKKVRHMRPKAIRKTSGEFYVVGLERIL